MLSTYRSLFKQHLLFSNVDALQDGVETVDETLAAASVLLSPAGSLTGDRLLIPNDRSRFCVGSKSDFLDATGLLVPVLGSCEVLKRGTHALVHRRVIYGIRTCPASPPQ